MGVCKLLDRPADPNDNTARLVAQIVAIAQHQWNRTGCNQVISGNARMRVADATHGMVRDSGFVGPDDTGMQVRPFAITGVSLGYSYALCRGLPRSESVDQSCDVLTNNRALTTVAAVRCSKRTSATMPSREVYSQRA
jgi:hypothetical protein